jgi:IS1 family transposase
MNRLSTEDRVRIISCLVEGNSIRATCRMTGHAKGSVMRLLSEIGEVCAAYHDKHVRNVAAKRIQCDEIWSFVGAKMSNATEKQVAGGWGDVWTWTALDADSKLVISYLVGQRGAAWANIFMKDVASRVTSRVQLTTDGHQAYVEAVEGAFGCDVDYAMLIKVYGNDTELDRRYSAGKVIDSTAVIVQGEPDPYSISTSYVERLNLTTRMQIRRFTRLTNAFSKKVENHAAAIALHFMHYNFCRIHKTLRVTPAMEANLTGRVWDVIDIVRLLEAEESSKAA